MTNDQCPMSNKPQSRPPSPAVIRHGVFGILWSLVIGHWSLVIAQVPPLRTEEWKFDVVHRTKGRLPLRGLVVQQTPTEVIIKVVQRKAGKPTVTMMDTVPRADVESVKLLDAKEREQLVERLDMLTRERSLLAAQLRLCKGGKI